MVLGKRRERSYPAQNGQRQRVAPSRSGPAWRPSGTETPKTASEVESEIAGDRPTASHIRSRGPADSDAHRNERVVIELLLSFSESAGEIDAEARESRD